MKRKTKGKTKVISVSNIKGGVGKSTTTATLAAGLHKKGYKVLIVDSDPQMNLTSCFYDPDEFIFSELDDEEIAEEERIDCKSLYNIYNGNVETEEAIIPVPLKNKKGKGLGQIIGYKDGFDLLVGDFQLCSADLEFFKKIGAEKVLNKALNKVKKNYDFVIIDTPPNLGILSLNAFVASDYILTPMAADSFSLRATKLLKKTISELDMDVSVIGILLTKYSDRTIVAKAINNDIERAAKALNTKVFKSTIRNSTVVVESQVVKMDLFDYSEKSAVAIDYDEFIKEFLKRV